MEGDPVFSFFQQCLVCVKTYLFALDRKQHQQSSGLISHQVMRKSPDWLYILFKFDFNDAIPEQEGMISIRLLAMLSYFGLLVSTLFVCKIPCLFFYHVEFRHKLKHVSSSFMAGSSTHSGSESSKLALKNKEIQFIKTTVEEHPVVIFSKSFCKYCRTARSILDSIGVDYKILELDKRCDGPVLQDALEEMTNARTVPRVFIKGQCIGGCSDLQTLHETGQLHNMLGDEVD